MWDVFLFDAFRWRVSILLPHEYSKLKLWSRLMSSLLKPPEFNDFQSPQTKVLSRSRTTIQSEPPHHTASPPHAFNLSLSISLCAQLAKLSKQHPLPFIYLSLSELLQAQSFPLVSFNGGRTLGRYNPKTLSSYSIHLRPSQTHM